jgi:hypothetical protein
VRYDDFAIVDYFLFRSLNRDLGHAVTMAYGFRFNDHWSATAESLRIDSTLASRR